MPIARYLIASISLCLAAMPAARAQENTVRAIADFIGVPFEPKMLSFHENRRYARTASYAQVTEPLYDRSLFRYRHYRKHLDPVIPILRPTIERLGYTVD